MTTTVSFPVIPDTEYLTFSRTASETGKTYVVQVLSARHPGVTLGEIRWYGRWRQYAFYPRPDTIWNPECMDGVSAAIRELMAHKRENTGASPADERFVASFHPQTWIRGYAVEVDPQGDTDWDVTEAFHQLPEEYKRQLLQEIDVHSLDGSDGEALDIHDHLKDDPNAPTWVRTWAGPFDIYVRKGTL